MKSLHRHTPSLFYLCPAGLLACILLNAGCVDEYWPDLGSEYQEVLVVEGAITNLPGPYTVRLSLSTSLEWPQYRPVTGYEVKILDDLGTIETLTDHNDGSYTSTNDGIRGIPGRRYKIILTSPEGNIYESNFEKLEEPVGIDTLWAEYETQENLAYDHLLEGYRFFVTTQPASKDSVYFLWNLEGTYQYRANHFIHYVFDGELRTFAYWDSLNVCWQTYQVPEIFSFNTLQVSEPFLAGYPLHYVNTEDKKLSIRYSLRAEQWVITKEAHEYWKNLREQAESLGSLHPVQPFQVRGNVRNVNDPEELVLGFFMAGAVTDYRIFVNRPTYAKFYYLQECALITEGYMYMLWLMIDHWPVYLAAVFGEYGHSPALPTDQECVDCTKSGGSIVKPEFWIDL
jgi:hypothetical protein